VSFHSAMPGMGAAGASSSAGAGVADSAEEADTCGGFALRAAGAGENELEKED
jgi:hypothetical protein